MGGSVEFNLSKMTSQSSVVIRKMVVENQN